MDFLNWIKQNNRYYNNKNKLVNSINAYDLFSSDVKLESFFIKFYEKSDDSITINDYDNVVAYLIKFFKLGIIQDEKIENNLIKLRIHLTHDYAIYVNCLFDINDNNLISHIKIFNKFFY